VKRDVTGYFFEASLDGEVASDRLVKEPVTRHTPVFRARILLVRSFQHAIFMGWPSPLLLPGRLVHTAAVPLANQSIRRQLWSFREQCLAQFRPGTTAIASYPSRSVARPAETAANRGGLVSAPESRWTTGRRVGPDSTTSPLLLVN
jgi:hypothetical protein